ncbi:hypothetical protein [Nocardioides rubriscoriae]|uniref:hypothetical protein n=1 Tax=Nocardioides rubriscoriae TaxID=642762 RepID=UPI0011DF7F66|nr:hypothetical protein [Nocardioides rubriscoriae]
MTKTKNLLTRRLCAVAVPALLAVSLTACGGGSDAPDDASKEDFCKAYQAEPEFDDALNDASPEEQAKAIKDAVTKLADDFEKVGTPKDIPDDAREGFEISLESARDLDTGDIQKAIEDKNGDFFDNLVTGDDQKKTKAFDDWASDYCG